jgi:hypothetical protein
MSRSTEKSRTLALVGKAEIADMLIRITQSGIQSLTFRDDFPAPLAELIGGEVWNHDEVVDWIISHPEALVDIFRPAAHSEPR